MSHLKPTQPESDITLNPADAEAFEWLRDGGEPDDEATRPRAVVMRAVMALLNQDAVGRETDEVAAGEVLVAATLARVAAARAERDRPVVICTLDGDDAAAVDAVLAAGGFSRGGAGPVPAGLGDRAQRVRGVLALLSQLPLDVEAKNESVGDDEVLVQRTLEAAAEDRQRLRFNQQIQMFSEPRRTLGVGWRQVLSAAAVFLLGISLLMPALDRQQQASQQAACSYNLGVAGQQMGQYTADHAGMLPRGPAGNSWIKAGQPDAVDKLGRYQSNSAHLYLLIREAYVAPQRLACGSNDTATAAMPGSGQIDWASPKAISYSYQNQHGAAPIRVEFSSPQLAVLADKSPLFVVENNRLVFNQKARRDASSILHRGKGQNILTLDGRVRWTIDPHVGTDNVWQIQNHTGAYAGTETPGDAHRDSFLVP